MISICAICKNEGLNLKEWLDYHILIGVEKFYIYDNESTDNTVSILTNYPQVRYTKIIGNQVQFKAYDHCIKNCDTDWLGIIDLDEFVIPIQDTLSEILKRYDDFGALAINWMIYGSSGHDKRPDGNVKDNYLYRASDDFEANKHVKCFIKPKVVNKCLTAHHFEFNNGFFAVDENYNRVDLPWTETYSGNVIRLNHYYCKSKEDYKMKNARGRADVVENTYGQGSFILHDRNEIFDDILKGKL